MDLREAKDQGPVAGAAALAVGEKISATQAAELHHRG